MMADERRFRDAPRLRSRRPLTQRDVTANDAIRRGARPRSAEVNTVEPMSAGMLGRARRAVALAVGAALLAGAAIAGVPPAGVQVASADVDTTPPTGSWSIASVDSTAKTVALTLAYSDPESALDRVRVGCDAEPSREFAYASPLAVPLAGPDGVGCGAGYGIKYLRVAVINDAGLVSTTTHESFWLLPAISLETPRPAVTGQLFTFRPVFPADLALSPQTVCTWELRWGSTASLRDFTKADESYGGLVFNGPKSKGYCGDWTFTLPWVPVRQFALTLDIFDDAANAAYKVEVGGEGQPFLAAAVGTTDRHIRSSNLPIAYILPDRYAIIVGEPVTYRLYTRGGASIGTRSPWTAFLTGTARGFTQFGGSSFTIVPSAPGNWTVSWNRSGGSYILGAYYDPPARYRDRTAPVTSDPRQRIATATQPLDPFVRVSVSWSGSDRGWGIARYQLQRSMNGGTWRSVVLASARATSIVQSLPVNTKWQYRVRAVDKARNAGAWRYGPGFSSGRLGEASSALTFRGTWATLDDATAIGGRYRAAATAGSSATLTLRGRDLAWVAPRGPGFGKAEVWVDGRRAAVVDLWAATAVARQVVYRAHWTTKSTHTVRIRVLGTAGRPTVGLDGFIVLR